MKYCDCHLRSHPTQEVLYAVLAVSCGVIAWGVAIAPVDFNDWSTMPNALALVRAICPNIWDHRDLLLGGGPAYGDQNRLRLDTAKILFELSLAP